MVDENAKEGGINVVEGADGQIDEEGGEARKKKINKRSEENQDNRGSEIISPASYVCWIIVFFCMELIANDQSADRN
jgi:hypothetical protein